MTTTIFDIILFIGFVCAVSLFLLTASSAARPAAVAFLILICLDYLLVAAAVWVVIALLHMAGVAAALSFSWTLALAIYLILIILKIVFFRR